MANLFAVGGKLAADWRAAGEFLLHVREASLRPRQRVGHCGSKWKGERPSTHTHRFAVGGRGVAGPGGAFALRLAGEGGAAGGLEAAAAETISAGDAEQRAEVGDVLAERRPEKKGLECDPPLTLAAPAFLDLESHLCHPACGLPAESAYFTGTAQAPPL